MVRFCLRCGTIEEDDGAVFCNRCGNRLPPVVPEKKERICPTCGTRNADMQAVFCSRCGSPLDAVPAVPVRPAARPEATRPVAARVRCPSCGAPRVDEYSDFCNVCGANFYQPVPPAAPAEPYMPPPARAAAPPVPAPEPYVPPPAKAAAPPVIAREHCPSCGAPLTDEKSDYCNVCGYRRRAAPPAAVPADLLPFPEKAAAAPPSAAGAGDGREPPGGKISRMPLMKWGLVAAVAVILLLVAVSFITGMIPGFGKQANATASSGDKDSGTTPAVTTTAPATVQTTAPAKTTTAVAAPAITANASATKAANASATATANATVTVTANATPAATPTLPLADASRPLPMGQGGYDGRGNLTVNDIAWKDRMSDPIPSYAIGKKYLIVNITYENLQQNGTVDADLSMLVLKDGGGFPFEPASDGMLESPWTGKAIGPKEKRTGNLLFIVPPEATLMKLYYTYGAGKTAAFTIT